MNEKIIWECPSNIALVKYWGKKEGQIPCNASISMTLAEAVSRVEITREEKKTSGVEVEYFFEGKQNEQFAQRILRYIIENRREFNVVDDYALRIESSNSFPHSTGIASSASAFGALALALLSMSDGIEESFWQKASDLARRGSGSACRSMYAPYALWGKLESVAHSSNEFAIPVEDVHENFRNMGDAILIVDEKPKKVSSSAGHALMNGHYYAQTRFKQANENCFNILKVLSNGNYEEFITIVEQEALALHAMMMTSKNYYLLMKPGTIHAIETLMDWRSQKKVPLCFTLDAGPNVHLLYPQEFEKEVKDFIANDLSGSIKKVIFDRTGVGPINLTS